MENKIVKATHGKAPIKLPPVIGKTPRAEHIRNSKTKAKRRTESVKSNKGKETLAAKENERPQQSSDQQQQQCEQLQQCKQQQQREQQHQPAHDSYLSEGEKIRATSAIGNKEECNLSVHMQCKSKF